VGASEAILTGSTELVVALFPSPAARLGPDVPDVAGDPAGCANTTAHSGKSCNRIPIIGSKVGTLTVLRLKSGISLFDAKI
jgi:hypothetical protein